MSGFDYTDLRFLAQDVLALVDWLRGNSASSSKQEYASASAGPSPGILDITRTPYASQRVPDIGEVRGQWDAKQAILIAAAGWHNLLLIGPPGEGKSLLAKCIPGFLPPPTVAQLEELKAVYSYSAIPLPVRASVDGSGVLEPIRPYRAVGPTIREASLIGGGRSEPIPGEVSLAHSGVLFLDELPQFGRQLIDALRQPLESKQVSITRNGSSVSFPADCILLAAMNPCPCGYAGYAPAIDEPDAVENATKHGKPLCICSPYDVRQYVSRISGPILDRIDLVVRLWPLSNRERFSPAVEKQSQYYLMRILQAWNTALIRQGMLNAGLDQKQVCDTSSNPLLFTPDGWRYFDIETSKSEGKYSTRKIVRLAKVSRTVADLSQSVGIQPQHIQLAINYTVSDLLS